jgi:BlaI family transcriptional regulator, penicillinase repressor
MASAAMSAVNGSRRRSILDLAPFELDCMNALWPLEEATVKQVQESLAAKRPRAYTTIMTILDRLAQKGIVTRRKAGRAYVYRANLRPSDAQESAVEHVIAGFFGGSRDALAAHLAGQSFSMVDTTAQTRATAPEKIPGPIVAAVKEESDAPASPVPELDRTLL